MLDKMGLIKAVNQSEAFLTRIPESVGSETDKAELMRKIRKKRKEEELSDSNSVTALLPDVTNRYTEKREDIDIETDIETEKRKDTEKTDAVVTQPEKKKAQKSYPDEFVKFWDIYPRHDNKSGAYEKFCARLKEGELAENMITAASNYAAKCRKNHTQREYIMMATTFVGPHLRYMDYLPKEPQKPKYTEMDENPFDAFVEG